MFEPIKINDIIDDRYKITESLGEGGMAVVYKAHDLITNKDVAIKMMRQETAASRANLNRFEREARAAASLNHSNIVKVINTSVYNSLPYIVNEFVDGQNLRQVLDVRGKFSFMETLDIMYQLCLAVGYAHNHGVIHRDIKPQNIFLTRDGTIKLGDFGIATIQQDSIHITKSDVIIGSVHYIAPEVAESIPATNRSDIYSMGITFFELITGRVPFDADTQIKVAMMQIKDKFPSIKKYNPKTPEAIERIIYKCVEKDPKDRYANVDLLKKDIETLLKNPSLLEKKQSTFFSFFKDLKEKRKEKKKLKGTRKE